MHWGRHIFFGNYQKTKMLIPNHFSFVELEGLPSVFFQFFNLLFWRRMEGREERRMLANNVYGQISKQVRRGVNIELDRSLFSIFLSKEELIGSANSKRIKWLRNNCQVPNCKFFYLPSAFIIIIKNSQTKNWLLTERWKSILIRFIARARILGHLVWMAPREVQGRKSWL